MESWLAHRGDPHLTDPSYSLPRLGVQGGPESHWDLGDPGERTPGSSLTGFISPCSRKASSSLKTQPPAFRFPGRTPFSPDTTPIIPDAGFPHPHGPQTSPSLPPQPSPPFNTFFPLGAGHSLTGSPLGPGGPCTPGSPWSPFSPASPGGPMRPINPMWPWRTKEACGEEEKGVLDLFS